MEPLILYPSKDRLQMGLISAGALMGLPFLIGFFGLTGMVPHLPTLCMFSFFGGAILLGKVIKMQRVEVPVFAADAFGFSLRGGRKIEWDKFKGIDTLPFDTAIKLQADGVGPRGRAEINTLELSGPAREMVKQIEDYAALARRNAVMGGAVGLGGARPGALTPMTLEEATTVQGAKPALVIPPATVAQPVPAAAPVFDAASIEADPNETGKLPPIELYPRKNGAFVALGIGVVFALVGRGVMNTEGAEGAMIGGGIFLGLGVLAIVQAIWVLLWNKPSFVADLDGFSVRGRAKRGWDEFRGVRVRTIRYGFFPIAKDVVIKTGKSILGGSMTINGLHRSGPAAEMAAEIADYAQRVALLRERGAVLDRLMATEPAPAPEPAFAPTDAVPQPVPVRPAAPQPVLSFEERLRQSGPIASTPRLSERIFGRRKVI